MGVSSSSTVFISDKDLNGNMDQAEVGLLVRPTIEIHKEECQTSTPRDRELIRLKQLPVQERGQEEDKDRQEDQKQQRDVIVSVPVAPLKNLRLEIPSYKGSEDDDSNGGFKTPTSSDQRIPVIPKCPAAPRKKKSRPATKRKACRQQIEVDLCEELESLFPTSFVVDLGAGGKIKRVKQLSAG